MYSNFGGIMLCVPQMTFVSRIARKTFSGVIGKEVTFTPNGVSASSTALAIAANDPIAPPSPTAFVPSSVVGQGD